MKKIVTILGARPQFVKAAVLSRIIASHNQIEEVIVHTGQHYDVNMSTVFFEEMHIPTPKYNLNINDMSHGAMTGHMFMAIEDVLEKEKPNAVVVFGDTNSTLAGALAAKKMNIKVIHIEAGLRSFNMKMPEEVNRVLTDRISDLLLCPTETAIQNLEKEGFHNFDSKVIKCGDIMKDAVTFYSQISADNSSILKDLKLENNKFVVATIHRQENTDDIAKLKTIFEALEAIHKEIEVILPLHPRTRKILEEHALHYNITTIDPIGYYDMLELLKSCAMVITDSGGLQKEAYFNKKHCIIVREETEWIELVSNDFATIVGSDTAKLIKAFHDFHHTNADFSMNLYGNDVGEYIHKEILSILK